MPLCKTRSAPSRPGLVATFFYAICLLFVFRFLLVCMYVFACLMHVGHIGLLGWWSVQASGNFEMRYFAIRITRYN